MAREHKTTPQYPIIALPLEDTDIVEVWRDGKQYHAPFATLGGVPDAHAPSHGLNGTDPVGTDTPDPNVIPVSDGQGTLDSWISDASTTKKGKVQLADSLESAAGKAMQSNDPRGNNARTPTAHVDSHLTGSDQIPDATNLARGLMGNGDKSKLDSIETALIPSNDEKAALGVLSPVVGALAGSYGTPSGTNRFVTRDDPVLLSGGGSGGVSSDYLAISKTGSPLVLSELFANPIGCRLSDSIFIAMGQDGEIDAIEWDGSELTLLDQYDYFPAFSYGVAIARIDDTHFGITHHYLGNKSLTVFEWTGTEIVFGNNITQLAQQAGQIGITVTGNRTLVQIDNNEKTLRAYVEEATPYRFYSTGNALPITGTFVRNSMGTLNNTDFCLMVTYNSKYYIRAYRFDGTDFTQVGEDHEVPIQGECLTPLSSTDVVIGSEVTDSIIVMRFLSSEWTQVFPAPMDFANSPMIIGLAPDRLVSIWAGGEAYLQMNTFLFGFESTSVNVTADYEVPELAVKKRIIIWKTSTYDGNPVTITPPSGATFEGLASIDLYGQYSYVELERISATVFAVKDEKSLASFVGPVDCSSRVAEYTGDGGGATIKDRAGNGNNLTATDITYVNGKFGKEMSFNGSTSYAQASSPVTCTTGTVAVRFKINTLKDYNTVYNNYNSAISGVYFRIEANGHLEIRVNPQYVDPNIILSTATYYSFVLTWGGTTIRLYKDGTQVYSVAQSLAHVISTKNLTLGKDNAASINYLDGIISHFRYDSRIWTADEARAWSMNPISIDSRV